MRATVFSETSIMIALEMTEATAVMHLKKYSTQMVNIYDIETFRNMSDDFITNFALVAWSCDYVAPL